MIEKILSRIDEISKLIRPVGWSRKIEVVETKAVREIVQEVAKEYGDGWIPTERELPPHSDDLLFVQCNGKPKKNITFKNPLELASYTEEGWILENYPEWENPDIVAWRELPAPYQKIEQKPYCSTCRHYESDTSSCSNGYSQYWRTIRCFDDTCEHWEQKGE